VARWEEWKAEHENVTDAGESAISMNMAIAALARTEAAEKPVSEFVGKVGDKVEIAGRVKTVREFYSQWGSNMLYVIETPEGDVVKTFYSGHSWRAKEGEEVIWKGTVKAHETHERFGKSTMMNRVRRVA
jgi:hypothetical protein